MTEEKIEQRAPDAPLAAPRWGTFEEFVAWFMKQPDDRVFDSPRSRCNHCVIATWLSELNNCPIHYGGYDNFGVYDTAKKSGSHWQYTRDGRFRAVAAKADRYRTATKRQLLDLGILGEYNS